MAEPLYKQNIWNREEDQSVLEIYDVETNERTVVAEMDYCIEAPNWTPDGKALVYNSEGCMFRIDLETKEISKIDTGYAIDCNNDHVLSADGRQLAVSHATNTVITSTAPGYNRKICKGSIL